MSWLDRAEFIKKKLAEIEGEDRKRREEKELFEKASSQEKIEELWENIDEVRGKEQSLYDYVNAVEKQWVQKYNELLSYIQCIAEEKDYRIVDRKTMLCEAKAGEVHNAILFFHGDGTITVKCSAESCDCKYGSREF